MHDAARREIIQVTPSKLRTLTSSITIITHDRHGCVRKRKHKSVYNMGGTVGSHIANRLGSLATERLEQLGHRLLFLENVNRRDSAINQDQLLYTFETKTLGVRCAYTSGSTTITFVWPTSPISKISRWAKSTTNSLAINKVARGRVLRVTDHTYDLRSHGGGTFYGVVLPACSRQRGDQRCRLGGSRSHAPRQKNRMVSEARRTKHHQIGVRERFRAVAGGASLAQRMPLDLDTCMLREDIEFLPRNFIGRKILVIACSTFKR